jgi:predicted DNA-binding ribbon-helix-helix protein
VTLSGHRTSITLEPIFWNILQSMARSENLNMSAFLAKIDKERIQAFPEHNFSSLLRLKVLEHLLESYPNDAIQGANSSNE